MRAQPPGGGDLVAAGHLQGRGATASLQRAPGRRVGPRGVRPLPDQLAGRVLQASQGAAGRGGLPARRRPVLGGQVDRAVQADALLLVHTPHLQDKYKGTRMIIDMLQNESRVRPERVLIDHVEEHTIKLALDAGFWVGMTLYPTTKCTPERAVDMIEKIVNVDKGMPIKRLIDETDCEQQRIIDSLFYFKKNGYIQFVNQQSHLQNSE